MESHSNSSEEQLKSLGPLTSKLRFVLICWIGLLAAFSGCSTNGPDSQPTDSITTKTDKPEPILLREGDVLKITFPGAPNLNTTQQIRRDGKITLPLVSDVYAAGKTRQQLEAELLDLYKSQLVTKEVTVTVESSSFDVYVTGAVLRPGKVISSRPLTALEAIMEAGGPDYSRANLKSVEVTRNNKDHMEHFKLNLKDVLNGKSNEPFYLKPSDIVFVPERFQWL
jgi:polysaccharide biosynthesis/export protein